MSAGEQLLRVLNFMLSTDGYGTLSEPGRYLEDAGDVQSHGHGSFSSLNHRDSASRSGAVSMEWNL
jgi:hypothetical protein